MKQAFTLPWNTNFFTHGIRCTKDTRRRQLYIFWYKFYSKLTFFDTDSLKMLSYKFANSVGELANFF